MNKKDINSIKKEFNLDTYKLRIKEIYTIFLKKDNKNIIFSENKAFDRLDVETRELYLENFKKLLTGTIDTKIFELNFSDTQNQDGTQHILYDALQENNISFKEAIDILIGKVSENFNYEMDIVLNFMRAEYYRGANNQKDEYDEALEDNQEVCEFLMGSINKVDIPKKTLVYDYNNREFRTSSSLDISINLGSPMEGFMFPAFDNGYSNVNNILYYTSKPKDRNIIFIENVLNCSVTLSAVEEKDGFNNILNSVTAGKITPKIIQEIYEEINEKATSAEEGEVATLNAKDIENMLINKNIEIFQDIEQACEEILCTREHEFKVENIVPKFNAKSIKIVNQDASINIAPSNLNSVKQVKDKEGNKCLLIRLSEDIEINGIKIEIEEEI